MARLDHGGHPRQISGRCCMTTNAIARARPPAKRARPRSQPGSGRLRTRGPVRRSALRAACGARFKRAPDRESAALPGPRSRRSRHPDRTGFPWPDALPPKFRASAACDVGVKMPLDRPAVVIDRLRRRHVEHGIAVEQRHLHEHRPGFFRAAPAHRAEYALGLAAAQISRHPYAGFQSHGLTIGQRQIRR